MNESTFKKIKIISTIFCSLILPLIIVFSIKILRTFLPDSIHLLFITTVALSTACLSQILDIFRNKKIIKFISDLFFILSNITWIFLYVQEFYIYKPQQWISIIFTIFSICLYILIHFFAGKNSLNNKILNTISFILATCILFISLTTAIYSKRLYSIPFIFGALTLLVLWCIKIFANKHNHQKKWEEILCYLLLISSQFLFSFTNILMISGF